MESTEAARMVSPQLRVRAAVLLIALGGLANIRALPRAIQLCQAAPKPDATVPFLAQYSALKPFVAECTSVGYLTEKEHLDPQRSDLAKRLYLTQFAVAPCIVEQRIDRSLVIFDSDQPDAVPEIATRKGWTLVTDLHDGVKLFRTTHLE